MKCRSDRCGSTNIQLLSAYWQSLPSDSPLKKSLAQPAAAESQFAWAVGVAVVGIAAVASGAVLAGLGVLLAGGLWGAGMWKRTEAAEAARAAWGLQVRCLACTETWQP
ncbi:hypothetical protein [Actinacidiphila oryziradicis]|uniref:Uncharacterized protein n=1 Tax=Actinacidiphila oryziradicis TaxID=2571141 RepID=A0A4U0RZU4_9ACTN|nr:hypothetical protein [Actinacidiphila oryziradicis]TKA01974.1 hypothetical protein FCI23_39565 [Actinacidiphila oryziradicis]